MQKNGVQAVDPEIPSFCPYWAIRTALSLFWGPYGRESSCSPCPGLSYALPQMDLPLQQGKAWLLLKLWEMLARLAPAWSGGAVLGWA